MSKTLRRQPGIMAFFSSLGAAILVMAMVVIGTMVYGVTVQSRQQVQFLNRTAACSEILADLYDMEQEFIEFGRNWSEAGYEAYLKSCGQLAEDLQTFQAYCQDVQPTLNDIRRIESFNLYQQQQIREAMEGERIHYDVYIYVVNGLNRHQQQAMEMAQSDMVSASNAYENVSHRLSRRMFFMAAVFAVMAVMMGVVLTRFSIVTKRAMDSMTGYFERLAAREWDTPDLEDSQYREFTLISRTANRMKQEIRNYVREIKNQARLEKQLGEERLINEKQQAMLISAQMSALRAQVNPHFLFNSLNLIGVTALVGDSKTVMQMVEATGRILRYSLYHRELMTGLDEELEIVSQYLFLQKCRFGDAVKVEIHNELEEEQIRIPTMTIQPIVENCFKHGFGNKENLHIHISVTWEGEQVSVCVMDDGIGFDPEMSLDKDEGGIGLNNIRKRLELMYGDGNAAMEIESEPGVYSSVTLLIPQKGGADEGPDR